MAPIHSLVRRKLLQVERRRVFQSAATAAEVSREAAPCLTPDQERALAAIRTVIHEGGHETILLFGVTGSGKTEVYIQAIQEVVQFGRQAIVLVPEISLTPQTRRRFQSRLPRVAVLHSQMKPAERHEQWRRIACDEVDVVVGARSAIFAPVRNLGLVVIDEEQESTFKQDIQPRYHARDVAAERARRAGVPLVLGSATPSLETWHRATQGHSRILHLPERANQCPLPRVSIVDLRREFRDRGLKGSLSRPLSQAMREALAAGGQVILLLNRRGFSSHIQCPSCGGVVRCEHCDVALTHHRDREVALCHYCEYELPTPPACPQCGFRGIRFGGTGTQRLEAEIRAAFPDAPCLRMDTDTMRGAGSHEQALDRFRKGEVRILVGTQMIAKGLDFPEVTLVGVVNADMALHLQDFRALERTFQLVTQVAGRTGRGPLGGRVIVQTFSPDLHVIRAAARHDYLDFVHRELPRRQALQYPPVTSLIRLVIRGPRNAAVREFAATVASEIRQAAADRSPALRLLGPAVPQVPRVRGMHRMHLFLLNANSDSLHDVLREAMPRLRTPPDIQWIVDVDPQQMM